MYVPINFYHGGALLVQRASLGDHPILRSRGGGIHPPLSQPCMAQMSPYEGLIIINVTYYNNVFAFLSEFCSFQRFFTDDVIKSNEKQIDFK